MDILKKIEQYREEEQRLKWEGTFARISGNRKRKSDCRAICSFPRLQYD